VPPHPANGLDAECFPGWVLSEEDDEPLESFVTLQLEAPNIKPIKANENALNLHLISIFLKTKCVFRLSPIMCVYHGNPEGRKTSDMSVLHYKSIASMFATVYKKTGVTLVLLSVIFPVGALAQQDATVVKTRQQAVDRMESFLQDNSRLQTANQLSQWSEKQSATVANL
jgi:hypothetical protein